MAIPAALAAQITIVVNSPVDVPDGNLGDSICETASGNGVCTLRAAVETANRLEGEWTVVQLAATTYDLSLGELALDFHRILTLRGAGALATTVRHAAGFPDSRLLAFDDGAVLTIEDLTVQGFRQSGAGGAISGGSTGLFVESAITVRDSYLLDNQSQWRGGFLYAFNADVAIDHCVFAFNSAADGADVYVDGTRGTSATVLSSIFEGGQAAAWGGSLVLAGVNDTGSESVALVARSFFSGNTADQGGAIAVRGGINRIANTTVSGNTARDSGGGIVVTTGAVLHLVNSTVTANLAEADHDHNGAGGGIYSDALTEIGIHNSILSGNHEARFSGACGCWFNFLQDCAGAISSNGYNLVGVDDDVCVITGAVSTADPLLGPATYNGGFNRVHALPPGSPAIDANPAGCYDELGAPVTTDQRLAPRPSGAACDLGAFEFGALIFDDDFELGSVGRWSAGS